MQRSRKPVRPTVDLFREHEILNVDMLHRAGAFAQPTYFPFRRLRTFPARVEIIFRDNHRPPQVLLIERTALHHTVRPDVWIGPILPH